MQGSPSVGRRPSRPASSRCPACDLNVRRAGGPIAIERPAEIEGGPDEPLPAPDCDPGDHRAHHRRDARPCAGRRRDLPGQERPHRLPRRRRRCRATDLHRPLEREAAAPRHQRRRHRGPPGLVARRSPDRVYAQRVFDRADQCRWRQPRRNRVRPGRLPQRCELHARWNAARVHPLRLRAGGRRDLEHEDRRLRPAVHHRPRWAGCQRLAGRPEDQLQGLTRRRLVCRKHRWQRRYPGLAVDLGHLQARLGAGRTAPGRQRRFSTPLRTRPSTS